MTASHDETARLQAVIERIRTHSRTARYMVDAAIVYVDSDGRDGLRYQEKPRNNPSR